MSALIIQVRHSAGLLVAIPLSSADERAVKVFCAVVIATLVGVLRQARCMSCVSTPRAAWILRHHGCHVAFHSASQACSASISNVRAPKIGSHCVAASDQIFHVNGGACGVGRAIAYVRAALTSRPPQPATAVLTLLRSLMKIL